MEKLPNELCGMIVTQLHNDFCLCSSDNLRPSALDYPGARDGTWSTKEPRLLQQELCKLRLVNKRFHAPATRYLSSHGTLAFDVSYLNSSGIKRQIEYCMSNENKSILAHISGLRINLLLSNSSRHLHLLDGQQPDATRVTPKKINDAEAAREEFFCTVLSVAKRFRSVTSLEVHLDQWGVGGQRIFRRNVECCIRWNLPKLKNLYIRGNVNAAIDLLQVGNISAEQCFQLRRLVLWCNKIDYVQVPNAIAHLKNITELGINGGLNGPLYLHPQHSDLTRLRLGRVWTSAEGLINLMTKGPTPAGGATSSDSPLVEVALSRVMLGSDPRRGMHPYEPGTWSSVFEAVRERCPHLTSLFAEWFAYHPAPVGYHVKASTEQVQREREDYRQLEKLVAIVRSRPGGYAYAGTCSVESRLYREF